MTEDEDRRDASTPAPRDAAATPHRVPPLSEGTATPLDDAEPAPHPVHAGDAATPGDSPSHDGLDLPRPPADAPSVGGPTADESLAVHGPATDAARAADPSPGFAFEPMAGTSPALDASGSSVASAGPSRSMAVPALLGVAILILLAALAYLLMAGPNGNRLDQVDAGVGDLTRRVAALEARPASPPGLEAVGSRLDGADRKLAAVAATVAALQGTLSAPSGAAPADLATQMTAVDAKVADLGRSLDELRTAMANRPTPDLAPLDGRIARLEGKVDALPGEAIAPLAARVDALDTRIKPVETELAAAKTPARVTEVRQNGTAAETRAAPLAVAAQAVTRAIDDGRPFGSDVAALTRLGADPQLIQPLQAVAANGAPSLKDLRADLAALRDRMVTGSTPAPSGSYLDRLMAGASTLVRVRPLGSVVGNSPAAILARMDADIGADDLDAALTEWQTLPEAARTVSAGLADRIRLRRAAETAAQTIAAHAIGALAAQP